MTEVKAEETLLTAENSPVNFHRFESNDCSGSGKLPKKGTVHKALDGEGIILGEGAQSGKPVTVAATESMILGTCAGEGGEQIVWDKINGQWLTGFQFNEQIIKGE